MYTRQQLQQQLQAVHMHQNTLLHVPKALKVARHRNSSWQHSPTQIVCRQLAGSSQHGDCRPSLDCRGVKRKLTQAQLDAAARDRKPATLDDGSPAKRVEFRGRITGTFEGGYVATVR